MELKDFQIIEILLLACPLFSRIGLLPPVGLHPGCLEPVPLVSSPVSSMGSNVDCCPVTS